ncbi:MULTISPECIES: hypothetical protein [Methylobacterium]|jgi:hypothetical protein|uniref:hypothetical protein n=1 Tax=Methylobacterium TaxID=407 RepID=UPI0012ED6085|nr:MULTISPECIES: hypothetical protein [Methylobacterium]NGM37316.1 hypothetical protein [Methylobacterium sp. DB0501]UHC20329.1 hypothetical protein LRS73_34365 [Methylobacterium currus]
MQQLTEKSPVCLTLGSLILSGTVKAVGDTIDMPASARSSAKKLRQLVLDFGNACAPIGLWLPIEEASRAA